MLNPTVIGKATLYNMDCMELLKETPDNFYELAIIDVPYGINVAKTGNVGGGKLAAVKNYGAKEWDLYTPDLDYFKQLTRVSKNQIMWGANHFMEKVAAPSPCWIVWDKDNSGNFADCELAYTSFDTAVRKFKYTWNGMLQGNMKKKEERIHPTQKPVALYEWLLTNYAKQGDKILDTHLGSGSHAIACNNLGFELTACELDKDYFDASVNRIEQATKQSTLFEPAKPVKSEQASLI